MSVEWEAWNKWEQEMFILAKTNPERQQAIKLATRFKAFELFQEV